MHGNVNRIKPPLIRVLFLKLKELAERCHSALRSSTPGPASTRRLSILCGDASPFIWIRKFNCACTGPLAKYLLKLQGLSAAERDLEESTREPTTPGHARLAAAGSDTFRVFPFPFVSVFFFHFFASLFSSTLDNTRALSTNASRTVHEVYGSSASLQLLQIPTIHYPTYSFAEATAMSPKLGFFFYKT